MGFLTALPLQDRLYEFVDRVAGWPQTPETAEAMRKPVTWFVGDVSFAALAYSMAATPSAPLAGVSSNPELRHNGGSQSRANAMGARDSGRLMY
jgi:hypothetical protein